MNDYVGCVCSVCNKPFAAGDDIVVCPECGTPYHRACYQAAGGCIAGAGTLRPIEQSHKEVEAFSSEACFTCANDTPYMDYLPLIEEKDKIRKL